MKTFAYKARDASGKLITGVIEAEGSDEAIENLKERKYLPISISEARKASSFLKNFNQRITLSEINIFSRQLAVLIRAGIPLVSSLSSIEEQIDNNLFKEVLNNVIRDIRGGKFFSEALAKYENIFGRVYVSMIKAAETAGGLGEILERLAVMGEREEDTKAQIKSATSYPIMVVGALCIAFFVLIVFVVPKFASIFSQFGTDLPLPTRLLIGLNKMLTSFWYLVIIFAVILVIAIKLFIRTPKGRFLWDTLKIKIPIIGPLTLQIILSRFSRVLGVLTKAGVPIISILDLTKENVANSVIGQAIGDISNRVTQGESLASAMKESGLFPPLVIQMISAGEGTGQLDSLLSFVSDYYDSQVKYRLKNLITYIEPILIVILGFGVLFIAVAVFLPMWDLMSLFKH